MTIRKEGFPRRESTGTAVIASPRQSGIIPIREDLDELVVDNRTAGFVEHVGNVFVALQGTIAASAVEVGQSLSRERAVEMVRHAARGSTA